MKNRGDWREEGFEDLSEVLESLQKDTVQKGLEATEEETSLTEEAILECAQAGANNEELSEAQRAADQHILEVSQSQREFAKEVADMHEKESHTPHSPAEIKTDKPTDKISAHLEKELDWHSKIYPVLMNWFKKAEELPHNPLSRILKKSARNISESKTSGEATEHLAQLADEVFMGRYHDYAHNLITPEDYRKAYELINGEGPDEDGMEYYLKPETNGYLDYLKNTIFLKRPVARSLIEEVANLHQVDDQKGITIKLKEAIKERTVSFDEAGAILSATESGFALPPTPIEGEKIEEAIKSEILKEIHATREIQEDTELLNRLSKEISAAQTQREVLQALRAANDLGVKIENPHKGAVDLHRLAWERINGIDKKEIVLPKTGLKPGAILTPEEAKRINAKTDQKIEATIQVQAENTNTETEEIQDEIEYEKIKENQTAGPQTQEEGGNGGGKEPPPEPPVFENDAPQEPEGDPKKTDSPEEKKKEKKEEKKTKEKDIGFEKRLEELFEKFSDKPEAQNALRQAVRAANEQERKRIILRALLGGKRSLRFIEAAFIVDLFRPEIGLEANSYQGTIDKKTSSLLQTKLLLIEETNPSREFGSLENSLSRERDKYQAALMICAAEKLNIVDPETKMELLGVISAEEKGVEKNKSSEVKKDTKQTTLTKRKDGDLEEDETEDEEVENELTPHQEKLATNLFQRTKVELKLPEEPDKEVMEEAKKDLDEARLLYAKDKSAKEKYEEARQKMMRLDRDKRFRSIATKTPVYLPALDQYWGGQKKQKGQPSYKSIPKAIFRNMLARREKSYNETRISHRKYLWNIFAAEMLQEWVIKEEERLNELRKGEALDKKDAKKKSKREGFWGKAFEKWQEMPAWKRSLISATVIGVPAGMMGAGIAAGGTLTVAGATLGSVLIRFARGVASATIGTKAGKWFEKKSNGLKKADEEFALRQNALAGKFRYKNVEGLLEEYKKNARTKKQKEKAFVLNKMMISMVAGLGAGAALSIAETMIFGSPSVEQVSDNKPDYQEQAQAQYEPSATSETIQKNFWSILPDEAKAAALKANLQEKTMEHLGGLRIDELLEKIPKRQALENLAIENPEELEKINANGLEISLETPADEKVLNLKMPEIALLETIRENSANINLTDKTISDLLSPDSPLKIKPEDIIKASAAYKESLQKLLESKFV